MWNPYQENAAIEQTKAITSCQAFRKLNDGTASKKKECRDKMVRHQGAKHELRKKVEKENKGKQKIAQGRKQTNHKPNTAENIKDTEGRNDKNSAK